MHLIFSLLPLTLCILSQPSALATTPELRPGLEQSSADEMRFPNGTVVGKYSYVDNEGTPVHVRYFADEMGYGVELRTMKVLDPKAPIEPKASTRAEKEVQTNEDINMDLRLKEYNSSINGIISKLLENKVQGKVKENLEMYDLGGEMADNSNTHNRTKRL